MWLVGIIQQAVIITVSSFSAAGTLWLNSIIYFFVILFNIFLLYLRFIAAKAELYMEHNHHTTFIKPTNQFSK